MSPGKQITLKRTGVQRLKERQAKLVEMQQAVLETKQDGIQRSAGVDEQVWKLQRALYFAYEETRDIAKKADMLYEMQQAEIRQCQNEESQLKKQVAKYEKDAEDHGALLFVVSRNFHEYKEKTKELLAEAKESMNKEEATASTHEGEKTAGKNQSWVPWGSWEDAKAQVPNEEQAEVKLPNAEEEHDKYKEMLMIAKEEQKESSEQNAEATQAAKQDGWVSYNSSSWSSKWDSGSVMNMCCKWFNKSIGWTALNNCVLCCLCVMNVDFGGFNWS